MKILYLTTGGSVHDYRFLVKLVERGYDTCYAYLEPAGKHFVVPGVAPVYLGVKPQDQPGGAATEAAPQPRHRALLDGVKKPLRFLGTAALYRAYLKNLKKLLGEFQPDILHAGWVLDAGFIAALSGFKPLLLMPWGSDILLYPGINRFYHAQVRYTLRRADRITCDAEEVKQRIGALAGYPPDKVIVFPWGIDLSLFRPDEEVRERTRRELGWEDNQILVMTRTFKPVYGVDDFIQALPEVFARHPKARALLIGNGPLEDELKALASGLGLTEKVKFIGAVKNDSLPDYLNAADLYVSSSLSDGASLSLLEAQACALPVVVTDVPAVLEWVEDKVNGRVAMRRNPKHLGGLIDELLLNESVRKEMGERNYDLSRVRADWEKNFSILEQLYKQLR